MTPLAVSAPVKAILFLVFIASLAGATWGVQNIIGDDIHLLSASGVGPARGLNATAGNTVAYPVTVTNHGASSEIFQVRLSGDGAQGISAARSVAADKNATFFVPVEIAADAAPGLHKLDLTILNGAGVAVRTRVGLTNVTVLARSTVTFQSGDSASVYYMGRITDTGAAFNSNDPRVVDLPFRKTDFYRASPGLLPVQTVPQPTVVTGFYEGMLGMQAGESRTISFPAEKGYGSGVDETTEKRDEALERVFNLELRVEQVGRDVFNDYVGSSNQGDGATFQANDTFIFTQGPNRWPYAIVSLDNSVVKYRLNVEAGQNFTLFPFWENASLVESVNETFATFVTTPTTAVDETFTMRSYWPDMSSVRSLNDTTILVRHSPPVGLKYLVPQGNSAPPVEFTVVRLTEQSIVLSAPSANPLAGKGLTFDVTLVELRKG